MWFDGKPNVGIPMITGAKYSIFEKNFWIISRQFFRWHYKGTSEIIWNIRKMTKKG